MGGAGVMRRGRRLGIEAMASPSCDQNRPELVHDWSKSKNGGKDCVLELCSLELGAAGRGCLRVRPRSAPVAPGLDGADEGLVPPGDLGGALVADLARLDAHRGVRKASPAAPTWRRRPLRRGARARRPRCRSRRRGCRSTSPRRSRRAPRCSPRARERAAAPRCAPAGGPSACARPPTRGPTAGPAAPTRRSSAAPRSPAAATAPPPGSTYAPQGLVDAPRPTAREAVATTTRTSPES